ncbi:hypothetical protein [Streptomyces sp. NPDC013187]|uniref:hypothetical protein n=1 Tax=Streptomyces sp. NPDC013187 TaxID=3364865 RepID=UPI0036876DAF
MVGLMACLLLLQLVAPGLAGDGRPAVTVAAAVDATAAGAASSAATEEAGESCPCEDEPSVRQLAARTPRAAGAAGVDPVVTGVAVAGRGGTDVRAAAMSPCPGAVGSVPSAERLQTFRC